RRGARRFAEVDEGAAGGVGVDGADGVEEAVDTAGDGQLRTPWAGGVDADCAARADVDGAGRRAGTDAERQARAAGHVADEEVRFVARAVPCLRGEAAAAVLL